MTDNWLERTELLLGSEKLDLLDWGVSGPMLPR